MERTTTFVHSFFSPFVIASIILIISICYFIFREIKTKKTGYILFGFALSLATLTPVSGIVPINGLLYEHWLYIPLVGFLIILFRIFEIICSSFFSKAGRKIFIYIPGTIIACILVMVTVRQNNLWSDPIIFYSYTLQFTKSARLENNLGMSYDAVGDANNAIIHYKKSLALESSYPQTHNNLGFTYSKGQQYTLAENEFKKALLLAPQFDVAKKNLLRLYLTTSEFQKAKELYKDDPEALEFIKSSEDKN